MSTLDDPHKDVREAIKEEINSVLGEFAKKASPLAISAFILVCGTILAVGAFIYFNKDTLLKWQENSLDIVHIRAEKQLEHDHCQEQIASQQNQITTLNKRVDSLELQLKQKTADNN